MAYKYSSSIKEHRLLFSRFWVFLAAQLGSCRCRPGALLTCLFLPPLGGSGEQSHGAGQWKAEEGSETVLPRRRSVFHIEWSSIRRRSKGVYVLYLPLRPQLPTSKQATVISTQWQYPLHSGPFNRWPRTKATGFPVSEHALPDGEIIQNKCDGL